MWRLLLIVVVACGHPHGRGDDTSAGDDARRDDAADHDSSAGGDGGTGDHVDAGHDDAAMVVVDAASPDAPAGIITGGPCSSGTAGATAYRIRWANSNGTAYVVYETHGLPDKSRNKAGAYGYQIGFKPSYVDPFLAQGGLQLDGSSFVDLELSTVGLATLTKATLSIYGRSYNTTASGSFNWQTFEDTGSTATNSVSNAAPYARYPGTMTSAISAGNGNVLIRV